MYGLLAQIFTGLSAAKKNREVQDRKRQRYIELISKPELTEKEEMDLLILRAEAGDAEAMQKVLDVAHGRHKPLQ